MRMRIVGLTGSIAMGKSTVAGMLRQLKIPVFDSDAAVHRLFLPGGAGVAAVRSLFPQTVTGQTVDRARLGALVFGTDPESRTRRAALEAAIHPLVRQAQQRFLQAQARQRRPLVVLDIPLLFETGAERRCDQVLVVSAPRFLQAQRALRRPGMTPARLHVILAAQIPDPQKRRKADGIITSGIGRNFTLRQLRQRLIQLTRQPLKPSLSRNRGGTRRMHSGSP